MSAGDWFSIAVILVAIVAIGAQLKRLGIDLTPRRFAQVVTLLYFVTINVLALTTTDVYILRSGILSKIGVLILLITIILDRGDC